MRSSPAMAAFIPLHPDHTRDRFVTGQAFLAFQCISVGNSDFQAQSFKFKVSSIEKYQSIQYDPVP
jgi:hypothetical protein